MNVKEAEVKSLHFRYVLIALLVAMGCVSLFIGLYLAFELMRLVSELDIDFWSAELLFIIGVYLPVSLGLTQIITAWLLHIYKASIQS